MRQYHLILCFGGLLYGGNPASAQKVYEGKYEWGGRNGQARFEYVNDRSGKSTLQGKFYFVSLQKDTLRQAALEKYEANGQYKQGKKQGKWLYQDEKHRIVLKDVINLEVVSDLESHIYQIQASYEQDLLQGLWSYQHQRYQEKTLETVSQIKTLQMKEGFVTGAFEFQHKEKLLFISGSCNAEGLMDGEWKFIYPLQGRNIEETRRYENGFLLSLQQRDADNKKMLLDLAYEDNKRKLAALAQKEKVEYRVSNTFFGLQFNDGYRRRSPEYAAQIEGNKHLEQALKLMLGQEKGYFSEKESKYPIRTKRFEYNLPKEREKELKELAELYPRLRETVRTQKNSNKLILNKEKSDSLAFAYAFILQMDEKLNKFENIVRILTSDNIKYFDESIYTRDGLEYLAPFDTVRYEFRGEKKEKVLNNRQVLDNSNHLSKSILAYLQYEENLTNPLVAFIKKELGQLEVIGNLDNLENQLLRQKKKVLLLLDSTSFVSPAQYQFHQKLKEKHFEGTLERLNQSYAAAENYEEKIQHIEQMLDILESIEAVCEESGAIFDRHKRIDEAYMENNFNAFTYTNYDVRVKERLYKAGNERLFRHYLEQLLSDKDYKEIKGYLPRIALLQERLLQLREEDTRAIERKLSSNTKPSAIESLLKIQ
jgi:hypothetical protein